MDRFLDGIGLGKYDRNARLRPALLTLLPALLLVGIWFKEAWTLLGSFAALVATCGLTFLLSRIARYRGRQIQKRQVSLLGGLPSEIYLRHRDDHLSPQTKAKYHAILKKKKQPIPTEADELADPVAADHMYRAAVEWLLEKTRGPKFAMLLDENIDYGFRRNLLALKGPSIVVLLAVIAANAILIILNRSPWSAQCTAGVALEIGLLGLGWIWLTIVNQRFVDDAGDSYARRLLAQLELL
jgi:hypothetical protein